MVLIKQSFKEFSKKCTFSIKKHLNELKKQQTDVTINQTVENVTSFLWNIKTYYYKCTKYNVYIMQDICIHQNKWRKVNISDLIQ